jgi:hypothetical protein
LVACIRNGAPAYEHFLAHEALASVQHAIGDHCARARSLAAAEAAFVTLAAADQQACRSALAKLKALDQ